MKHQWHTRQWSHGKRRGWPYALYPCGKLCAWVEGERSYTPRLARSASENLTVFVKDYEGGHIILHAKATTLAEAKSRVQTILREHPECIPQIYRGNT